MIHRSYDKELLMKATEPLRWLNSKELLDAWWECPGSVMLTDGENVGLATCEYPGMYTCHLYFTARGREAIELGKAMLLHLFDNYGAKAVRGLIKVKFKAARWAARQMGWESLGIFTFPNGDDELFYGTRKTFMDRELT